MGWSSRLRDDEDSNGRGFMGIRSGRRPRRLKRRHEGKETRGVGGWLRRRKRGYKAHNAEVPRDALREVGGGHRVAMKAWTAQPAGAKGLCLSRASYAGGTA